jgi:hypothetical protein
MKLTLKSVLPPTAFPSLLVLICLTGHFLTRHQCQAQASRENSPGPVPSDRADRAKIGGSTQSSFQGLASEPRRLGGADETAAVTNTSLSSFTSIPGVDSGAARFISGAETGRLTLDSRLADLDEPERALLSLSRDAAEEAISSDTVMFADITGSNGEMAVLEDILFYEPAPMVFLLPALLVFLDLFWSYFNRSVPGTGAGDGVWAVRRKF